LELAQESADFDLPRSNVPPQFHYIGLIHRTYADNVPFPFERLDGRPVVYASLGTVYDSESIFRKVAEACANLDLQLIVTLGSKGDASRYNDLPGSPIVVNYAPQRAVLQRTALTICHAGHNTVLDSLECGVPVIAIPVQTGDTGTAARLRHSGAGEWIKLNRLTAERLGDAIGRIISDPSYKQRAQVMGASIKRAGGEHRAADLIEKKLALS
jgi:MGT family glycosyltransferase